MSTRADAIFRKEDLLAIESVLYEAKKEELVARQIARVNTNYPAYAKEIGYDWYDRTGSAKIIASGGSAKDIPFVGEKGGRETAKVYTIATGIRYTREEREAMQAKSALGKGPTVQLDTLRIETARRFVAETENDLFFNGNADYNIKGVLNKENIIAEGLTLVDGSTKLADKTPQQILKDINKAKKKIQAKGIFKARVLVLSPEDYDNLFQPYSDQSTMTVYEWLNSKGMTFEKIISSSHMLAENNIINQDIFLMLDNSPEVIELAMPRELELGEPIYDILQTSEQAVTERCAGATIRHPSAIYVGIQNA